MRFLAPTGFADWMTNNKHIDKRFGHVYRYHSRSDSHSKSLCLLILQDLLAACPVLAQHASAGKIVYGINLKYTWPRSSKEKTIDLGFGLSAGTPIELLPNQLIVQGEIQRVLFSCEDMHDGARKVPTEDLR